MCCLKIATFHASEVWKIMFSGAKKSAFSLHPTVNPEIGKIEFFGLDKIFRRTKLFVHQKFSCAIFSSMLGVLLMFCLFFTKFQPSVAYKIVAYKKKSVYLGCVLSGYKKVFFKNNELVNL